MAPGRGLGGEDDELRALLREALLRIGRLEERQAKIDLARLGNAELRAEMYDLRDRLRGIERILEAPRSG